MPISCIEDLADIPHQTMIGVVINVDTPLVSLLAIVSSAAHLKLPLLLVECSQGGLSVDLSAIDLPVTVNILHWSRRWHGLALDEILLRLDAEVVVLIDSDVEILSARTFAQMKAALEDHDTYGSGMLHPATWMDDHHASYGYYVERMWIPFCCLKVEPVRAVIRAGHSFVDQRLPNEIASLDRLSAILMTRWRYPLLRELRLDWLR